MEDISDLRSDIKKLDNKFDKVDDRFDKKDLHKRIDKFMFWSYIGLTLTSIFLTLGLK